jgi:hypothetical protein
MIVLGSKVDCENQYRWWLVDWSTKLQLEELALWRSILVVEEIPRWCGVLLADVGRPIEE